MGMSSLTNEVHYVSNYSSRNGRGICKITPHHMAGNLSLQTCANVLENGGASANYGIDSNGRIACFVDEDFRSWCSCSYDNDSQAITIEVANDGGDPDWHISDEALESLINLCVDICRRYGFRLNYTGDANGNLTRHNMFYPTTCPGPYLQSKFSYIQEEVNKRLGKHIIAEDGLWGRDTTLKIQEVFNLECKDGIVSNQLSWWRDENPGLLDSTFEWKDYMAGGSLTIVAIQNWLGVNPDGYIGSETISALQRKMGTPVDGCVSNPSAMVSAFQRWLNKQ